MSTTVPQAGTIQFVEAFVPTLGAGEYLMSVEQAVTGRDSHGTAINETYVHARRLFVQGERFALDPSDVISVFPANLNRGDHDNALPHIVFGRKTLPWERDAGVRAVLDKAPTNQAPWLALLVFSDDDPPVVAKNVKLGELGRGSYLPDSQATTPVASQLPADTASYEDGYAATYRKSQTWMLEPGQNAWEMCRVIDVPVDLFASIAPSCTDLGWLAHARVISGSGVVAAAGGANGDGDFSLVMANRFPEPNAGTTVHLVSLEGMAAFLPGDDAGLPAPIHTTAGQNAAYVRLVSLYSWSFTCEDPTEGFVGYLEHLDVGPFAPVDAQPEAPDDGDRTVQQAFAMGYTALNHDTRYGDQTVSWYRGPFVPFSASIPDQVPRPAIDDDGNPTGTSPICTADEALRYDPDTGMFDVSLAAAWQLGRLMALRDKSFSLALFRWKRLNVHKTFAAVHAQAVQEHFGAALSLVSPPGTDVRVAAAPAAHHPPAPDPARARRAAFGLVGQLGPLFDSLKANRPEGPKKENS